MSDDPQPPILPRPVGRRPPLTAAQRWKIGRAMVAIGCIACLGGIAGLAVELIFGEWDELPLIISAGAAGLGFLVIRAGLDLMGLGDDPDDATHDRRSAEDRRQDSPGNHASPGSDQGSGAASSESSSASSSES